MELRLSAGWRIDLYSTSEAKVILFGSTRLDDLVAFLVLFMPSGR
jgi:hypothetical protein